MAHITIPAADPFIRYDGDGTTVAFPFPFPFFDAEDITVYVDGVETGSGYAVSGDPLDGGFQDGTVTFVTAPAAGAKIILVRQLDIERLTDFPYPSQVLDIQGVNSEYDRIVAMLQGIGLDSRRALRVPAAEITVDEVPGITDRANKVLGFDGNGQPIALTYNSEDGTISGSVEAIVNNYLARVFPVGIIMLWRGSVATIPSGWALCDGNNGTPDLRNRFVVGAGSTYAVNATGGAASVTSGAGGAHNHGGVTGSHTLTTAQIPAHNHSVTDPGHTHTFVGKTLATTGDTGDGLAYNGDAPAAYQDAGGSINSATTGITIANAGGGEAHSHTISTSSDHTHTVATLPPYYALAYIMRTSSFLSVPGDVVDEAVLPDIAKKAVIQFAVSDETTAITSGTAKIQLRAPFAMTVTAVRASLNSACATGTFTVDINLGDSPATMLSTKLTIDATEKTSTTALVPAVLSSTSIADDQLITVDVDDAGDGTAKGLKIVILGTYA